MNDVRTNRDRKAGSRVINSLLAALDAEPRRDLILKNIRELQEMFATTATPGDYDSDRAEAA